MKAVYKFSYMTIDNFGYFEPEEKMTYDEAIEWTKTRGLRLLTRGEWCDLWDHKEEFRKSCRPERYWTASLHIEQPRFAWYFYGKYGYNEYRNCSQSCTVRAVLAEPEGHHAY